MRSPWRTLVAGLTLALATAAAAIVPSAQAAGITIAIDPGHGGSDSGAVANGLKEKDLTLAVSLALKEELESYDGVRVVMTRTTDTRPLGGAGKRSAPSRRAPWNKDFEFD